jgi:O-antigen/teichoic acid export membrane protein
MSNTQRIVKNTLMLYFRQILIMLVSLYTVRVVLETLGAEDYGIYNVVAGVVSMFGFLSNSMVTATQRYLSFELGRNDFDKLKKVFSVSLVIYVLIMITVLLLAETVGLWFVSNKLVIPPERKNSAIWVYQFSVISFLFTVLTTPYMAVILAHEDMNIYAHVSTVETALRLGLVFVLQFIAWDKLRLYGILVGVATLINTAIYRIVCMVKYKECKFMIYFDRGLYKELKNYAAWNLFGSVSTMLQNQGIAVLLNQFFNPVVVTARGIALSVNSATSSFAGNFYNAIRPQIIKKYAANEKDAMMKLVFYGAKATYFLMYIFTLPLILEMRYVLMLWLKNIPEYTVIFTSMALIEMLIYSLSMPLGALVHACGKIQLYQLVVYGIQICNLPLAFVFFKLGSPSYTISIIAIFLASFSFIAQLLISKYLAEFPVRVFLKKVVIPLFIVTILSPVIPILIQKFADQNFSRLIIVIITSIFSTCGFMYFIGLNKVERIKLFSLVLRKIQ